MKSVCWISGENLFKPKPGLYLPFWRVKVENPKGIKVINWYVK